MNWKVFAQALRLVSRRVSTPSVRYRPYLDSLEDRTVLSTIVFNEVQGQSILTLSGTIAGKKLKPQGPGALTTTYFGTFEANVDEANGSIRFIQTGNDFCAANTGNWAPLEDGSGGTAPAIYGFQMKSHHVVLQAAIRDFHMNADTGGTSLPLYQNDDGSFGFPSAQNIAISAGSGTYAQSTLGHGPLNFGGLHANNQAGDGQLIDNGRTLTITVPISVSMSGTISGIDFTLNVNGQIVGMANSPGPNGAGHSGRDAALSLALGAGTGSIGAATSGASLGLASERLPGGPRATTETAAAVPGAQPDDALAQLAHRVLPTTIDPFLALDAVLEQLA